MENRKDLLIYGFGGFGHEVACLINHINAEEPRWNLLGYIDDGVAVGTECRYGKVLGNIDTVNSWDKPVSVVIAIGNCRVVESLSQKISNKNVDFPNIIAPNVFFFDNVDTWREFNILILIDSLTFIVSVRFMTSKVKEANEDKSVNKGFIVPF